jgi:hypothetical protein
MPLPKERLCLPSRVSHASEPKQAQNTQKTKTTVSGKAAVASVMILEIAMGFFNLFD